ncbi:substrate-binding domain-containing protein [Robertmurraya andreesenii]|uniref:Tungstate transport system substrate-binding protein n=1 Tax=Anoxybacillus andreesenii TaxID=1325932 RepID=A0ABT9V2U1_9BACL|nr:substrate-binding domain-containing protein [Robertmurraya andreesenii]MDQ0155254.1 tungstate transport system substrate-binding protein [Robertmurraya andreesenii]
MKLKRFMSTALIAFLLVFLAACGNTQSSEPKKEDNNNAAQQEKEKVEVTDLILATTTSTQDSGLLDELIPMFEKEHPYKIKTVAVGTGQALEMGVKGEADVLLTHAPASEQELVDNGDVQNYKRVMYNDFIIVGPKADPAGIKGLETQAAFKKIFDDKAIFVSRGDDSGTHKKELGIWEKLGLTPTENTNYVETGQGMGNTLQVANEKQGYVLTDRATYLAQKSNYADMEIIVEGDKDLMNIYHVMEVNPEKNDQINNEGAKAFVEFMVSDEIQKVIEEFGKDKYGESLFYKYTE